MSKSQIKVSFENIFYLFRDRSHGEHVHWEKAFREIRLSRFLDYPKVGLLHEFLELREWTGDGRVGFVEYRCVVFGEVFFNDDHPILVEHFRDFFEKRN